jgi:hypothetical protein
MPIQENPLFEGVAANGDHVIFIAGDDFYRVVRRGKVPFDEIYSELPRAMNEFSSVCIHMQQATAPPTNQAAEPFDARPVQ